MLCLDRLPRGHARRGLAMLGAVFALAAVAACSEKLESAGTCPILCPEQSIDIKDTVLFAVALDTTVGPYPATGTESTIPLIYSGDSVETRAVLRFDGLTSKITPVITGATELPIEFVDSARVLLRFVDTLSVRTSPVTIEVYDVDTTAADTTPMAADALFRDERRLGSVVLPPGDVEDSAFVFLDSTRVLSTLLAKGRLRLGVRVRSDETLFLRLVAAPAGQQAILGYRARADTAVRSLTFTPVSLTPSENPSLRNDLIDYTVVHSGAASLASDELVVGGLPARRAYLRFDIPSSILDSTTIIRATLLLTQRPSGALFRDQSTTVFAQTVLAGKEITDPGKAVLILAPLTGTGLDSLRILPSESGERSLEIANTVAYWRARPDSLLPRAIVLRSPVEGTLLRELRFYSAEAAGDLRPRLSISYIPRVEFGLP